jgi:hypothetical protein
VFSFLGHQISTIKNIIATYTKDFEQKKLAKIHQNSKEKNKIQIARLLG